MISNNIDVISAVYNNFIDECKDIRACNNLSGLFFYFTTKFNVMADLKGGDENDEKCGKDL